MKEKHKNHKFLYWFDFTKSTSSLLLSTPEILLKHQELGIQDSPM